MNMSYFLIKAYKEEIDELRFLMHLGIYRLGHHIELTITIEYMNTIGFVIRIPNERFHITWEDYDKFCSERNNGLLT